MLIQIFALAPLLAAWFPAASADEPPDLYDQRVLRSLNLTFYQPDWWQLLKQYYHTGVYVEADLEVEGVIYPRVGVALRGQLAYNTGSEFKKPFKIKMDAFVPDQELLGYDSLRLNNASEDPTFCREALMSTLCARFMPMPRYNWVKMTINGENWGVYVNEQTKDRRWAGQWYRKDSGNRYKFGGGNLNYLGPDPPPYMEKYRLTNEPKKDSWYDLIRLCDVLNNTPLGPTLTEALWPIVDLDEVLWEVASDALFVNLDSYYVNASNYYIVQDEYHGLMQLINHDLNLTFGTWRTPGHEIEPDYKFEHKRIPLVKNVMLDLRMKQEYYAHLLTMAETIFDWEVILPMVQEYQDFIRAEVYADQKKIFSNQAFEDNVTQEMHGEFFRIPGLRPFVNARQRFLVTHPYLAVPRVRFVNVERVPDQPMSGQAVTIRATVGSAVSAASVELRWRTVGAFARTPMFDDGQNGDGEAGDGIYGAAIPPQPAATRVEYYLVAEAQLSGAMQFEPGSGGFGAYSYQVGSMEPIVLNEFLAENDGGLADGNNDRDDWIELLNRGSAPVDLGGMYLTDDRLALTQWQIPPDTTLEAGQTLLVWADGETDEGPLHANFKLNADGEEILLVNVDGATVIDGINFGAQLPDVATGRLFDGELPWVTLRSPTPDTSNEISCGARHFDALSASANRASLTLAGDPKLTQTITLSITGGTPNALGVLYFCTSSLPSVQDDDDVLLVQLAPSFPLFLGLDSLGSATLTATIPDDPSLDGLTLYLQHLSLHPYTNAIEVNVCR